MPACSVPAPLVLSAHLDDAVLSCGSLLASRPGAVVATVFAGRRGPDPAADEWGSFCGGRHGGGPAGIGRDEDFRALALLGARPRWIEFAGGDGGRGLGGALAALLDRLRPPMVLVPLGLFHDDHIVTADAVRPLLAGRPQVAWYAYEDVPYRAIPGLVDDRLEELAVARVDVQPAALPAHPDPGRKARAVLYRSRLRDLNGSGSLVRAEAAREERYWRLVPGRD